MRVCLDPHLAVGWRSFKVHPPTLSTTFFVKAAFKLEPGGLKPWPEDITVLGDVHQDDDPAQCLRYPSDFSPFKPRADLLLVGTAHAPGGQPALSFPVRFTVGRSSKTIQVFGKREWRSRMLGTTMEPEPIAALPLTYANSAGGPKDRKNPLGKGSEAEAPNLEHASARDREEGKKDGPACFAPIPASWLPRSGLVGTYGKDYQKERWPWLPKDFDYGHFNAAPRDQQVDGYLRGNEDVILENLHAEHGVYRTRLPGQRARWFVNERQPDGSLTFKEVPLQLDTLWIDMDSEQLILVWRGLMETRTMRMREIASVLVLLESLAEPPHGLDHYRAELERRLTTEEISEEEIAARAQVEEAKKQAAAVAPELAKSKAEAEAKRAEQEAARKAAGTPPPRPAPTLREIRDRLAGEIASQQKAGVPPNAPQFVAMTRRLAQLDEALKKLPPQDLITPAMVIEGARAGRSFHGRNLADFDLSGSDLQGIDLSKALLLNANLAGANLSKANLSGALINESDLTAANLSGANLAGTVVFKAILAKANFGGAQLNGAILARHDLAGADFTGAKGKSVDFSEAVLTGARFAGADLPSCDFSSCRLEKADFRGAALIAADFDGVKAAGINMEGANLTKFQSSLEADYTEANLKNVKGDGSVWQQATLDGADLSGASFVRAIFGEASLRGADFDRANLTAADFSDAILEGAKLTRANLLRATFHRADLHEADLTDANAYEAGFWDARMEDAILSRANLKNTLLS